jgi:hypothetical protein
VLVEPAGEGAVRLPQLDDPPRVLDHGVDLQPVSDDPGVGEKATALPRAIGRDGLGREAVEGASEGLLLLQDREPGEAGLVDLEREPLEKPVVPADREAVFAVVVGTVEGMPGSDLAVGRRPRRRRVSRRRAAASSRKRQAPVSVSSPGT